MPEQKLQYTYRQTRYPVLVIRWIVAGFLLLHASTMTFAAFHGSSGGRIPVGLVLFEWAVVGGFWYVFNNSRQVMEIGDRGVSFWIGPFGMISSYLPLNEVTSVTVRPREWWEAFQHGNYWRKSRAIYFGGDWVVDVQQANGWMWSIGTDNPEGLVAALRERMPGL